MKDHNKSSPFHVQVVVLLLSTITLVACSDAEWTKTITGEPGSAVLNAPRAVGAPPSLNGDEWPNLAEVPDAPDDFTSQEEWDKMSRKMGADRKKALAAKRRLDAEAPTVEQSEETNVLLPPQKY